MAFPVLNPLVQGMLVGQDQISNILSQLNLAVSDASQLNAAINPTGQDTAAFIWPVAQLVQSGLFVLTPTAGRTQGIDTAANIGAYLQQIYPQIAGQPILLNGAQFKFRFLNTSAFVITMSQASAGVTYTSSPVALNVAATQWRDFVVQLGVTLVNGLPVFTAVLTATGSGTV